MRESKIGRKIFQLVIILMFTLNYAYGQDQDFKIGKDEIIQKAWRAMFGELKPNDLKSIYVESFYHGSKVPNQITIKCPNKFRNVISSGILVFDGERAAWAKRSNDKNGDPRNPELIEAESWKHFEVDIALVFPAFFDYPSEVLGKEEVQGKDAYKIFVALPLGGNLTYLVDSETFLVVKRLVSWGGNENKWENLIHGYKDYNGVLFPSGFSYEAQGKKENAYYKNLKLNIKTEDKLFEIPEGL